MLEFAGGVGFGVDVADFFELECAFQCAIWIVKRRVLKKSAFSNLREICAATADDLRL